MIIENRPGAAGNIGAEAAAKAGRDPLSLVIAIEGAGALRPDNLERTAERLGQFKEMGVFHAILGVHPAHMADAAPVIDEFASKHLPALQA